MKTSNRIVVIIILVSSILTGILFFIAGLLFVIPETVSRRYNAVLSHSPIRDTTDYQTIKQEELEIIIRKLRQKIDRLTPKGAFLIINTTNNSFELSKNNRIIRTGLCSTGSFVHLEADSTTSWLFETPKGVFTVRDKIKNPLWRKPDWAFIEEGLPVPPLNDPIRFERNVMGDYALNIGNGYLIHGTLYQRLLGMPVTHGCVRLNDQDLSEIYHTLEVGSKVFIY